MWALGLKDSNINEDLYISEASHQNVEFSVESIIDERFINPDLDTGQPNSTTKSIWEFVKPLTIGASLLGSLVSQLVTKQHKKLD
jgi:hypothetical protein